ncbi:MAG: ECF RNA polymerase sigma factor SigR [Bacteroidetes bacterium ADurb.Bin234]|jgi:RNA polymerase sigma-70 factor (ECF subfamily)|nr:MAG: ECF RNA polymerase sigma factor SigR [Bacteroidetes bacterium ADurb.Bin234]
MFSEEEIIKECIKGNRKAEKHLYTKYNGLFFAICLRYTQSREEAEDVLITGFTSIFESLPMYKKQGSFEGWMKRIIINTAVNHYRTNKKHLSNIDIEEIDTINEISQKSYQDINVKDILNQIQMMPEGYKQVFNLFAIEGYKHTEIAEMLHIAENTSKSQYAKAKKWLQRRLEDFKY